MTWLCDFIKRWRKPEPEFVHLHICIESKLLPSDFCETTVLAHYLKGNEPTRECDICCPEPIPDYQAQFLGSWSWFRLEAWEEEKQRSAELEARRLVREIRRHRFSLHDGFLWVCSGEAQHKLLNQKTPYKWIKEKKLFDLEEWEYRFWELMEQWLIIHKDYGLDYAAQLFMSFGYNIFPYRNNVQGIVADQIWDKKIRKYQYALAEKVIKTYRKVYSPNYKPYLKICNEPAHGDSARRFHDIMYFHEDLWEDVLSKYMPLNHLIVDISKCEGALGELREPHKCGKPTACDNEGMHGKPGYDRLAIGELHGFSTISDFKAKEDGRERIDAYLASGNKYRRFTEDGGGHAKDGKGEVWGKYVFGDAKQQYEMMKYVWTKAKQKGKRVIYCSFPVEALKRVDGVNVPDYRVESINWDRFKAIAKAWDEVYR